MVHSETGKILLRGNDYLRAGNRCNDIEGAQPKKMRQRSVPTNPLAPAYQPLESIVLPPKSKVRRDDLQEERALGAGPVPWSGTASLGMDSSGHLLHLSRQTELAELWESQGELRMQGRRTRKDYRDTNNISDIEKAQPAPLLGRNGEGKMVMDMTRDGLATITSLAITSDNKLAASPGVHPNEPRPQHPREPPPPLPYASVKDEEVRGKDERMATQLLASGFSAAEAQRMMRRAQATGGRSGYGAVERAAGWGRSTIPVAMQSVGKKTFTDTAYETHLETHISMPGLQVAATPTLTLTPTPTLSLTPTPKPSPYRSPSPSASPYPCSSCNAPWGACHCISTPRTSRPSSRSGSTRARPRRRRTRRRWRRPRRRGSAG